MLGQLDEGQTQSEATGSGCVSALKKAVIYFVLEKGVLESRPQSDPMETG